MMRWCRHVALFIGAAVLLGLLTPRLTWCEMRGNYYVDSLHHVSFARPNDAWKFLSVPPPKTTVVPLCRPLAVFSSGDGQAIAMLSHWPIEHGSSIQSVDDLKDRWPSLIRQIIAKVSTGESLQLIEDSACMVTGDAIGFHVRFRSAASGDEGVLENWVAGFLVRDTMDQQQICAIRCAAPQAAYNAWQSEFARIMSTLRFEGQHRAPVFLPRPFLVHWWYFTPAVILLGVLLLRRRSRKQESQEAVRTQLRSLASDRVQADLQNVPDRILNPDGPDHLEGPPASLELSNVPDLLTITGLSEALPAIDEQDHTQKAGAATTGTAVAAQPAVASGFWKCACGRVNPGTDEFCARCNEDRTGK